MAFNTKPKSHKTEYNLNKVANPKAKGVQNSIKSLSTSKMKKQAWYNKASEKFKAQSVKKTCIYFLSGCCRDGDECTFSHDVTSDMMTRFLEPCRYYVFDDCTKGAFCCYMHENFPCLYYHNERGNLCKNGDTCRFSHDPLTPNTKAALLAFEKKQREKKMNIDVSKDSQSLIKPIQSDFGMAVLAQEISKDVEPEEPQREAEIVVNSEDNMEQFGFGRLLFQSMFVEQESKDDEPKVTSVIGTSNETMKAPTFIQVTDMDSDDDLDVGKFTGLQAEKKDVNRSITIEKKNNLSQKNQIFAIQNFPETEAQQILSANRNILEESNIPQVAREGNKEEHAIDGIRKNAHKTQNICLEIQDDVQKVQEHNKEPLEVEGLQNGKQVINVPSKVKPRENDYDSLRVVSEIRRGTKPVQEKNHESQNDPQTYSDVDHLQGMNYRVKLTEGTDKEVRKTKKRSNKTQKVTKKTSKVPQIQELCSDPLSHRDSEGGTLNAQERKRKSPGSDRQIVSEDASPAKLFKTSETTVDLSVKSDLDLLDGDMEELDFEELEELSVAAEFLRGTDYTVECRREPTDKGGYRLRPLAVAPRIDYLQMDIDGLYRLEHKFRDPRIRDHPLALKTDWSLWFP